MLAPDLNNVQLGSIAETLVQYKLLRWGYDAIQVSQDYAYDLLIVQDRPIRVQVKSTLKIYGSSSYQFKTTRGSGATKAYKASHYDILACVALDIERVLFMCHTPQKTIRVRPNKFTASTEMESWQRSLDSLDRLVV